MATEFQLDEHIDIKTSMTVSGYLRALNDSNLLMVPPLVDRVSLLYFHETEHFEIHGKAIELSEDKMLATHIGGGDMEWEEQDACVYGNLEINNTFPCTVYQWTFQIFTNKAENTAIGICSTTQYLNRWFNTEITANSQDEMTDEFYLFGFRGSIVTMECDINAQTLSFNVDDNPKVAVFEEIDFDKTYKVGIIMHNPDDAVKLISLKQWVVAPK